jgi:hypothetical protein
LNNFLVWIFLNLELFIFKHFFKFEICSFPKSVQFEVCSELWKLKQTVGLNALNVWRERTNSGE